MCRCKWNELVLTVRKRVALIVTVGFFTRACLRDGSGSGFNEAELGQRKPEDATQTPSQYPPQNQYQYPQQ